MTNQWIFIGYYICRCEECPKYLNNLSDMILSVSDCMCIHEPQIDLSHGWKLNGDNKDYIDKNFECAADYLRMSEEINRLFNNHLFFIDGRFLRFDDAKYFFDTYFNSGDYKLIVARMATKYKELLCDDFAMNNECAYENLYEHLGCDIIGWDISGFHSFLCNSLQENYPNLRFNKYGLINEDYSVAEDIAMEIQGKGEPVEWIPVEILLCN